MSNLINIMENMVELHLDECIADLHACACERCREDIKALTLNNLPPYYVTQPQSTTMVLYKLNTIQGKTDIHAAITESIKKVTARPRHDKD